MKKLLAFLLVLSMIISFVGCTAKNNADGPESALVLLENVWAKYQENEKFSAAGGDFSEENQRMDAPGKFSLEDKEALASTFCLDAETAALVDDAASLMHMMLANNFTAVALRVTDVQDTEKVTKSLRENIQNNRWLCGFPEEMYIATVGNYVVSVFGASDLVEVFDTHLKEAYTDTKVVFEEPIA